MFRHLTRLPPLLELPAKCLPDWLIKQTGRWLPIPVMSQARRPAPAWRAAASRRAARSRCCPARRPHQPRASRPARAPPPRAPCARPPSPRAALQPPPCMQAHQMWQHATQGCIATHRCNLAVFLVGTVGIIRLGILYIDMLYKSLQVHTALPHLANYLLPQGHTPTIGTRIAFHA